MKAMALSKKVSLVSGLILVIFCLASFGILYRAQMQLVTQEMDTLLGSETLALSALVSTKPSGVVEFEMSPSFFSQYKKFEPFRFFRFLDSRDNRLLRESSNAPALGCGETGKDISKSISSDHRVYRIKTSTFSPEIDSDSKATRSTQPSSVCLIVGVDEAPYQAMVIKTLLSTIPVLLFLVILLIGILLMLVKRVTGDLSRLTATLETADFGATHNFPALPEANTPEVRAVGEKLAVLHTQAAEVYRDMWLFLGRAAHQLKTPVTAMQATLQVLLRKERTKEELISGLADVETATSQLVGLTRKLISSSRISYQSAPKLEAIELNAFLLEQIKLFDSQARQLGVSIQLNSAPTSAIYADSSLLSEVFGNLIENAILYSPHVQGATVKVSWAIETPNVVVSISDQGTGIPAQVRRALFEPFVRGDERQAQGSGLGLSIAKRAAKLLNGDVILKSTGEFGSIIAVTLPLAGKKSPGESTRN
jgi:signal transduction histidine kinase